MSPFLLVSRTSLMHTEMHTHARTHARAHHFLSPPSAGASVRLRACERVRSASPASSPLGSARRVARSFSFGKSAATKRAIAEMLACYHNVRLDKRQGDIGITLTNSDSRVADSRRRCA